jgi:carbohydrate kinase (thermoresistant glucokinase family)
MIRDKQMSAAAPPARQVATPKSGNETASSPRKSSVVVVMGVSGCGKSTIASMLAHRLNWIYEDGDWFHPQSNVRKMHAGEPLTDEDRWPWLHGIAAWIDATRRVGNHGTVACSALKRAYRDILVGERRDVRIVYLKGERDLIARRLAARDGHFMPPSLLDSQFAALEEPQPDEHPIVVSIVPHPREIVEEIVKRLGEDASPPPPETAAR